MSEGLDNLNLPLPNTIVEIFLGPLVMGIMIEQFMLGIICFQAVAYFRYHFSNDSTFCRSIITCLVASTVFLGILDFTIIYRSLVWKYGDPQKFDVQDWMIWTEPSLTAWIAFVAHIFYIFRCRAVTRSSAVCVFLGVVALGALVSGIMTTVLCFRLGRLSNLPRIITVTTCWFVLTAICDLSIAIVLVLYLWRKDSVLRSNSAMISRLQRTSVETGLLTAICVLSNSIFLACMPDKGYDMLIHFSLSHLYTISVLYTLLGREDLRNILHGGSGTLVSDFQSSFLAAGALSTTSLDNRFKGEVHRRRNQTSNV